MQGKWIGVKALALAVAGCGITEQERTTGGAASPAGAGSTGPGGTSNVGSGNQPGTDDTSAPNR